MTKPAWVRLHYRDKDGTIRDAQADYELSAFGGFLPATGDLILDAGVASGLDRTDAKNRRMWTVVQRVFNPRDNEDCVVLVVEERQPLASEIELLPQG
ncbi:MAG: hypothetical protein AB7F72_01770 [Afipia sp.]